MPTFKQPAGTTGLLSAAARPALAAALLAAAAPALAAAPAFETRAPEIPATEAGAPDAKDIIVTAQKRSERSLEVPISLTVLNDKDLAAVQAYRYEDYLAKVPGLSLIGVGGFGSQLVVRGVTTGTYAINSSVATYVDETPFSSNGSSGLSAFIAPNFDPYDMQRIEVLRGPQGTLYGANSLGGLFKYVTNAPDPARIAASADVDVNAVDHGAAGINLHGMVNAPLSGKAALRVVGFYDESPGYVDDPSRGLKDINTSTMVGGRASLLFKLADTLSIRLNATYQHRKWSDYSSIDVLPVTFQPIYGGMISETLVGNPGAATNQVYNATVDWDIGFATLLSSSSYIEYASQAQFDVSGTYGAFLSPILGSPYGAIIDQKSGMHAYTQEFRLTSPTGPKLQWQAGAYYMKQSGFVNQDTYPVDIASKTIVRDFPFQLGGFYNDQTYNEISGFGTLGYNFTPAFDVSVGGRYSHNNQTFTENGFGLLGGGILLSAPSSEDVFTYSADARWRVTPQVMLYGRFATGYVPGGGNNVPITAPATLPRSYKSSKTTNYELGAKGSLFDNKLTFEVAAYQIDWANIQLAASYGGVLTTLNAGGAKSTGFEWSFGFVPVKGLTLGFNGSHTKARLKEAAPATVGGAAGERLPGSPEWSTSASVQYDYPLAAHFDGFVAADWQHSSNRLSDFSAIGARQTFPSYNMVNLRLGLKSARWTATAYVRNLTNTFAISNISATTLADNFGPLAANIYQPRTFGIAIGVRY